MTTMRHRPLALMVILAAGAPLAAALMAPGVLPLPIGIAAAGPSPTAIIAATAQVDRGKTLFAMHCAKCHGEQGQGGEEAPRIIGNPSPIKGHKTAQALFDFVRSEMPFDAPGSLDAQVYWDVLAFILDANRLLPPDTNLGPENAANIKVSD